MNNRYSDKKLSFDLITGSDTISQFMEKCNNNFSKIIESNGGPDGKQGDKGEQGIPTKPKVPIHVWRKGIEYKSENKEPNTNVFYITEWYVDLTDEKYQEGHLIMLENGHAYILEVNDLELNPKFIIEIQSIDPDTVYDGKNAYIHIAYSDSEDGTKNFITEQDLRKIIIDNNTELFNLKNTENSESDSDSDSDINNIYSINRSYIGIYSDFNEVSEKDEAYYTWIRIRDFEYNITLSNQITPIHVGNDYNCINENQEYTFVYLYDNLLDISTNKNIEISLPEDNDYVKDGYFSIVVPEKDGDINKIVFNPIVNGKPFNFTPNSPYKLPITLKYYLKGKNEEEDKNNSNCFVSTIFWTLTPIKELENIKIFVDKTVVNISESDTQKFKVGYHLTYSNGDKKFINKNENKDYEIILTDDINNLKQNGYIVVYDWEKAEYDFVNENNISEICYVVLVEKDNKNIVDYTTITPLKNGIHGKDATHLELTKEHIILPYNIDGTKIHPDYIYPIQSQMLLYIGNILIDNNIEYKFKKINYVTNNENNDIEYVDITDQITIEEDGKFYIPKDIIDGNKEIVCIASYDGKEFKKTLFIELKETPYKLELDKTILSRDTNDSIKNSDIKAYIKYYMDGKWNISDEEYTIIASWDENNEPFKKENEYYILYINDDNFLKNKNVNKVEIYCLKDGNDDNKLFHKTIEIINDGKNGKDGSTNDVLKTRENDNGNNILIEKDNIIIKNFDNSEIVKFSSNIIDITYENTHAKIDKDGVIINTNGDGSENFKINNEEILMKIGRFGISITDNGMSITTDSGETWNKFIDAETYK